MERNKYITCLNCLYLKFQKQNKVYVIFCKMRMWEDFYGAEKVFKISDQELRENRIKVRKTFFIAEKCKFFESVD